MVNLNAEEIIKMFFLVLRSMSGWLSKSINITNKIQFWDLFYILRNSIISFKSINVVAYQMSLVASFMSECDMKMQMPSTNSRQTKTIFVTPAIVSTGCSVVVVAVIAALRRVTIIYYLEKQHINNTVSRLTNSS